MSSVTTLNYERHYAYRQGGSIRRANRTQRLEFGKRLKEAFERAGYLGRGSASRVAEKIGARPTLVSSWLRGDAMPSRQYPARLIALLGPDAARTLWEFGAPSGAADRTPHSASLRAVREGTPVTLANVSSMIARAVGRAVERTLASDEMQHTRKGQEAIADWLLETAELFSRWGADNSELIAAARALQKGKIK